MRLSFRSSERAFSVSPELDHSQPPGDEPGAFFLHGRIAAWNPRPGRGRRASPLSCVCRLISRAACFILYLYYPLIEILNSLRLDLRHAIYLHYALRAAPRLTQIHLANLIQAFYQRIVLHERIKLPPPELRLASLLFLSGSLEELRLTRPRPRAFSALPSEDRRATVLGPFVCL